MAEKKDRQQQAKLLRISRKLHRKTGALLFIFFFIIAITGLALGWKKHSGGIILAKTHKGTSTKLADWLPIDSLQKNAFKILHDSVDKTLSLRPNRIDIRPEKDTVKFVFEDHFWGLQLDGATGNLLHIEQRRSDFIENIHDGSILDRYFRTSYNQIKLICTSIMGIALLIFTITGYGLWYGPKRMRRQTVK